MKKILKIRPTADDALAAAAGTLFSLSLLSGALAPLGWACFAPLLWAIRGKSPSRALRLGIVSGTFMNAVSLYWLVGTLVRFGGIPAPASVAMVLVFCVYSSLQFGIFAWYVSRFGLLRGKSVPKAVVISLGWTAAEFFFPVLFPYGIGISQAHHPAAIQAVDLFGVSFLGFVMFFANVAVFYLADDLRRGKRPAPAQPAAAAVAVVLVFCYGFFRLAEMESFLSEKPRTSVAVVQANFSAFEKNFRNEPLITERHREMSRELSGADLVIWPETSVQQWFPREDPVYRSRYGKKVVPEGHGSHFLIGGSSYAVNPEPPEGGSEEEAFTKYNSAFLVDSESRVLAHYSKTRLFLMGEYFPMIDGKLRFLKKVFPMIGNLTPGEGPRVLEVPGKDIRIGPLICYEDIMAELSRNYVKMGANLLVNLTNDAWFGNTSAPHQHLLLSVPRAVETRRYLVRSTNSGISAIVSPTGRIEARTGVFTTENLSGEVVLIDSVETLYSRLGDVFPWTALCVTVLFMVRTYLGKKYADRDGLSPGD